MFERAFLGQVRISGMGQTPTPTGGGGSPAAQGTPTPASPGPGGFHGGPGAGARFFNVPFVPGLSYPPAYPPDQYTCTLSPDGKFWICSPIAWNPPVLIGAPYPVVPFGVAGPVIPFGVAGY